MKYVFIFLLILGFCSSEISIANENNKPNRKYDSCVNDIEWLKTLSWKLQIKYSFIEKKFLVRDIKEIEKENFLYKHIKNDKERCKIIGNEIKKKYSIMYDI